MKYLKMIPRLIFEIKKTNNILEICEESPLKERGALLLPDHSNVMNYSVSVIWAKNEVYMVKTKYHLRLYPSSKKYFEFHQCLDLVGTNLFDFRRYPLTIFFV